MNTETHGVDEREDWRDYRRHVLGELERLKEMIADLTRGQIEMDKRLALMCRDIEQIKVQRQDAGAKVWQVSMAVGASLLSLAVAIAVVWSQRGTP